MPLVEEYDSRREQVPVGPAKKILFDVMDDLLNRRGFDNTWDDADDDTREELFGTLLGIVEKNMPTNRT